MANVHWHVKVDGEIDRQFGALATTLEAAQAEEKIEKECNSSRRTKILECRSDCFGGSPLK
ncbi:MAG: hypothetical protein KGR26_00400 [Cyanobacteria bacterium REEB65]|nr:hypothetical protein [Cyanobacteria bacterium REEB65]